MWSPGGRPAAVRPSRDRPRAEAGAPARRLPRHPLRLVLLAPLLLAAVVAHDALGVWTRAGTGALACAGGVALVMGAAQYDGTPSPALRGRLDRARELYRSDCVTRIVVSGGRQVGDRYTEGESGVRYLRAHGVPAKDLAAERHARTSLENLDFSRPLLGDDEVVIVTDDLHAYRSAWLARRLGMRAQVAAVGTHTGRLAYAAREVAILAAYRLGVVR